MGASTLFRRSATGTGASSKEYPMQQILDIVGQVKTFFSGLKDLFSGLKDVLTVVSSSTK